MLLQHSIENSAATCPHAPKMIFSYKLNCYNVFDIMLSYIYKTKGKRRGGPSSYPDVKVNGNEWKLMKFVNEIMKTCKFNMKLLVVNDVNRN